MKRFLVFLKVMNKNTAYKYDRTIPMVQSSTPTKYAVVDVDDILCSVGLVKSS